MDIVGHIVEHRLGHMIERRLGWVSLQSMTMVIELPIVKRQVGHKIRQQAIGQLIKRLVIKQPIERLVVEQQLITTRDITK